MNKVTILQGHVMEVLKGLPDEIVHCVITSPPYWGLRDYGIEPQVWPDGWRGSLGLEPTIELFVQHIVEVFREVRRVLRKDGVCFVNLGDSYANSGSGGGGNLKGNEHGQHENMKGKRPRANNGLKPKDLCGVPWRVAFALQANGWWLRSDIIWNKPNPMPESVTDRPTKSHEFIFLLTKSAKYFWDAEGIREEVSGNAHAGRNDCELSPKYGKNDMEGFNQRAGTWKQTYLPAGRNLRTVWTIPTAPFPEAHFATFPPKLVETCLKAGTSEHGVCPTCGAPWVRVVEKKGGTTGRSWHDHSNDLQDGNSRIDYGSLATSGDKPYQVKTLGFRPSCKCADNAPVPATALDPFGGAGTVGLVAAKMGRNAILIELKPDYCDMAEKRIRADMGMMVEVVRE